MFLLSPLYYVYVEKYVLSTLCIGICKQFHCMQPCKQDFKTRMLHVHVYNHL